MDGAPGSEFYKNVREMSDNGDDGGVGGKIADSKDPSKVWSCNKGR